MAFIELKHIDYQLKIKGHEKSQLFSQLNLSMEKGDLVALVGPNGVGKTTLTKLMLGFIQPDHGEVLLEGLRVSDYKRSEVGAKIGYLFQNPMLQLFNATVEEELLFAYAIHDRVDETIRQRYNAVLKDLDLDHVVNTSVFHLSQGEKQRLAIGTLLMNQPDFMILDEPTSGLDYVRKEALKNRLLALHKKGMGMLIVTHDLGFIEDMPVKVLKMSEGQVAYEVES